MSDDNQIREYLEPEDQLAAENEKARLHRESELDDLRVLLKFPAGVRFFVRLLREGQIFGTTFTGDALRTAFLEGHRNLALKIFNDIVEADPSKITELLAEGKDIDKKFDTTG